MDVHAGEMDHLEGRGRVRADPWKSNLGEEDVAAASGECSIEEFDTKGGKTELVRIGAG